MKTETNIEDMQKEKETERHRQTEMKEKKGRLVGEVVQMRGCG